MDGSEEENEALCQQMVESGTFIKLSPELWPGCYYSKSDPGDVTRVEDRTFICSLSKEAIQDLLDELESLKQSRLRAWSVLQRLRLVLSDTGNVAIAPPARKTFDAEGEALEHALTKSLRIRSEAIKSLCSSVRRFRTPP